MPALISHQVLVQSLLQNGTTEAPTQALTSNEALVQSLLQNGTIESPTPAQVMMINMQCDEVTLTCTEDHAIGASLANLRPDGILVVRMVGGDKRAQSLDALRLEAVLRLATKKQDGERKVVTKVKAVALAEDSWCVVVTSRKKIRVYMDGVCDLFHYGHVNAFKSAKGMGDELFVGVHTDETVRGYKREPVTKEYEREKVVAGCRYVDKVIHDAPIHVTPEYLESMEIDILAVGDGYSDAEVKMMFGACIDGGVLIKRYNYTKEISTSDIIMRIKEGEDRGAKKVVGLHAE